MRNSGWATANEVSTMNNNDVTNGENNRYFEKPDVCKFHINRDPSTNISVYKSIHGQDDYELAYLA